MSLLARNVDGVRCNGSLSGGSGLNRDEARANIQKFCQSLNTNSIASRTDHTTTYKPSLGNSNTVISITFIDDGGCGQNSAIQLSQDGCASTLYSLIDNCDADEGYLGRYGGEATEGCVNFSISSEVEEAIRCDGNPHHPPANLDDWAVNQAIEQYCSDSMTLSPDFTTTHFTQQVPNGQSYANIPAGELFVRVAAQFSDQGQEGCKEAQSFETNGQECRRKLRAVWDRCGVKGGGLSENSVNGCIVWTMWGQAVG